MEGRAAQQPFQSEHMQPSGSWMVPWHIWQVAHTRHRTTPILNLRYPSTQVPITMDDATRGLRTGVPVDRDSEFHFSKRRHDQVWSAGCSESAEEVSLVVPPSSPHNAHFDGVPQSEGGLWASGLGCRKSNCHFVAYKIVSHRAPVSSTERWVGTSR